MVPVVAAIHFLIAIKEALTFQASVPIWKREVYEDGSSWKQNGESGH